MCTNKSKLALSSLMSPFTISVSIFGAKATNLAKAAQLGFTVPSGLAISRYCDIDEFALMAQEIIDRLSMPVAVRSSATKEDSRTEAFAGMFETLLGVGTTTDLVDAFSKVKNSGANSRIEKYHGEAIPPEFISVLIQEMVDATRAGVAFSRDPVTGESKVIIESNYGLGKSVVDGDVTPDSIEYLDDDNYETFIGRKSIQVLLDNNGVLVKDTPTIDTNRISLEREEIKGIAHLAQRVERELGFPADIEWAFDADGTLWLLQARPITTL